MVDRAGHIIVHPCVSMAKGQQAIRELARATHDRTGNPPLLTDIFPACSATIRIRERGDQDEN